MTSLRQRMIEELTRRRLKPTTRQVWAPRGKRPGAVQHLGYEWLYLYGFVRPTTGDVEWLLLPSVNTITFNIAPRISPRRWGRARRSASSSTELAGTRAAPSIGLSASTHCSCPPIPRVAAAEKLWPLVREAPANRLLRSLDELEALLVNRCRKLTAMPKHIRGCTRFPWWPDA